MGNSLGGGKVPRSQQYVFLVMIAVAIIGTVAFGVSGYMDTQKIVDRIYSDQTGVTRALIENFKSDRDAAPLLLHAALEIDTVAARNNRAASLLATRTWIRFLTTMSAAIIIVLGAAFVIGRINVEASKLEGEGAGFKATLATTSPGLVLVVVGAILLGSELVTQRELATNDGASYGQYTISDVQGAGRVTVGLSPVGGTAPEGAAANLSDEEIAKRIQRRKGATDAKQ